MRGLRNSKLWPCYSHWSGFNLTPCHEMTIILGLRATLNDFLLFMLFFRFLLPMIFFPLRSDFLLLNLLPHSIDGIIKFAIGINYLFRLLILRGLQWAKIVLSIKEEWIFSLLLGYWGINAVNVGIILKHIVIWKGIEFIGICNH